MKIRQGLVSNSSSSSYYFICSSRRKLSSPRFIEALRRAEREEYRSPSDPPVEELCKEIHRRGKLQGQFSALKNRLVGELKEDIPRYIEDCKWDLARLEERVKADPQLREEEGDSFRGIQRRINFLEETQQQLEGLTTFEEIQPLLKSFAWKEEYSCTPLFNDRNQYLPLESLLALFSLDSIQGRDSDWVYYIEIGDGGGYNELTHNGFHYFRQEGLFVLGDVLCWAQCNH